MTPGRLLAAFAFYAAALDLGWSRGLVSAVASPAGMALLVGAGVLLAWRAARALRSDGSILRRASAALASGGAGLALVALPASLATRDARPLTVGERQAFPPGRLPGLGPVRFGDVELAPRGPHLLSKTVSIEAEEDGAAPVRIGLFPPAALGPWRTSVFRFGYAAGVTWLGDGGPLVQGYVMLGTLPHTEEEAALVQWTPEANVMMGAGTFPPRLEDLVSPPGAGAHLFVRLDAATIAGTRRDLRDPDAYRWLVDGRPEDPEFFVQAFRGREKVFEGKLRGGQAARFPGGSVALEPDVVLWVDLLAVRDPFLPWVAAGLVALAAGLALRAGTAIRGAVGRAAFRASGS